MWTVGTTLINSINILLVWNRFTKFYSCHWNMSVLPDLCFVDYWLCNINLQFLQLFFFVLTFRCHNIWWRWLVVMANWFVFWATNDTDLAHELINTSYVFASFQPLDYILFSVAIYLCGCKVLTMTEHQFHFQWKKCNILFSCLHRWEQRYF